MLAYLQSSEVVDWEHRAVREVAMTLVVTGDLIQTAKRCFEFVRDAIKHSRDFELDPAPCRASEVPEHVWLLICVPQGSSISKQSWRNPWSAL